MKRGREYHGYGEENIVETKGNRKKCNLPYNIEAVGKKIKWEESRLKIV